MKTKQQSTSKPNKMWKNDQQISRNQAQEIWATEARGLANVNSITAQKIIEHVQKLSGKKVVVDYVLSMWHDEATPKAPYSFKNFLLSFSDPELINPFKGVRVKGDSKLNAELIAGVVAKNPEVVKKCLLNGADPNVKGTNDSILYEALTREYNYDIIQMLLQAGADQNYEHHEYGCHHSSSESCFQRAVAISKQDDGGKLFQLFLRYGADPNKSSHNTFGGMRTDGSTTLCLIHTAIDNGAISLAQTLLEAGADPNAIYQRRVENEYGHRENTEMSALHYACRPSRTGEDSKKIAVDLAQLLLQFGADVNATCSYLEEVRIAPAKGRDPRSGDYESGLTHYKVVATPLHTAITAAKTNPALVHLLVLVGADTNIPMRKTHYKDKPLEISVKTLCGSNNDLLHALAVEFQPLHFHVLPSLVRKVIKTFLLCNERKGWGLPPELRSLIFTYLIKAHWTQ